MRARTHTLCACMLIHPRTHARRCSGVVGLFPLRRHVLNQTAKTHACIGAGVLYERSALPSEKARAHCSPATITGPTNGLVPHLEHTWSTPCSGNKARLMVFLHSIKPRDIIFRNQSSYVINDIWSRGQPPILRILAGRKAQLEPGAGFRGRGVRR